MGKEAEDAEMRHARQSITGRRLDGELAHGDGAEELEGKAREDAALPARVGLQGAAQECCRRAAVLRAGAPRASRQLRRPEASLAQRYVVRTPAPSERVASVRETLRPGRTVLASVPIRSPSLDHATTAMVIAGQTVAAIEPKQARTKENAQRRIPLTYAVF